MSAADAATPAATPTPAEGTAYHRMATLRPEWARPTKALLALAAAFIAYVVLISVVLVGMVLILAVAPGVNVARGVTAGDPTSPLDVGLALAMGAMWLPAGIIGVRAGGWRPLGTAWSIAGRLRSALRGPYVTAGLVGGLAVIGLAALAGGIAGGAGGAAGGASAAADGIAADGGASSPLQLLLLAVLVLLLAPLQAAGLELALRGVVMQAFGAVLRSPAVPVLMGALVMLVGRELTPAVVLPALALGLASGLLAWKSGGLELPIALTTTMTAGSHLVSALAAGTGAGAGTAALTAAVAAPGTSAAALAASATGAHSATLAAGVTSAIALLVLAVLLAAWVGKRAGLPLLAPVTRPASEPAPAAIPH